MWDPSCFGYTIGAPDDDLSFDERDSAPFVPKAVVVDSGFDWVKHTAPRVPWHRTIFYETHVRGYTRRHPAVAERHRGTFAGLATAQVIEYIKSLGVTSVELMPIHTFLNDGHLLEKGLTNYWGYNSIAFFAADPRYFADPLRGVQEFKEMVARFHDAGLEVILDVVYNHTAEGNERGATLSFRGIDNLTYYRLMPEQRRYYINDTGTGNTLDLSHPRVIQMVTDSLRYWVQEMHVDGFRFDLGTILAREPNGFHNRSGFLKACSQDPVLGGVKLIAEPWDCGPGGYQVGEFPPGWAEWNDKFRDTVRDYWRGEAPAGALRAAPVRVGGYFRSARPPPAGERQLRDGARRLHAQRPRFLQRAAQRSERRGQPGRCVAQPLVELRRRGADRRRGRERAARAADAQPSRYVAAVARHADAAGRRRVRAHAGRQQQRLLPGQRNQLGGLGLAEANFRQVRFVQSLTALRRRYPILRRNRFLSTIVNEAIGVKEVTWINVSGAEMREEDWTNPTPCFGMLLDGRAQVTGIKQRGQDATMLLIVSSYHDPVPFTLPAAGDDRALARWQLLLDTQFSEPAHTGDNEYGAGDVYSVAARSLLLLKLKLSPEAPLWSEQR